MQEGRYTGDDWLIASVYVGASMKDNKEWMVHITTNHLHASEMGPADAKEDARLIASAPDLLAACKALVQFLDKGDYRSNQMTDIVNAARAAIEKAEGNNG